MIKKIVAGIEKHKLLKTGETVVVAVSGGPDSVALLKSLLDISAGYKLELIVAHFNHALRGEESDRDERFVAALAGKWGLPCEMGRADARDRGSLKRTSPEDAARVERYRFLAGVAARHGADKIALGHHLHDQSETIIMNLLRGTGIEGLRGMTPVRDGIFIRPLLGITRNEILDFLKADNLESRTDSSNQSAAFQRNRIRHQLVPELRRNYNPRLEEQLCRLGEIVALEDDFMNSAVSEILGKWGVVSGERNSEIGIDRLTELHEALQRRIVKAMLEGLSPQKNGIEYNHILSVVNLCRSGSPHGRLDLPFGIRIRRAYNELRISACEDSPAGGLFSYALEVPGETFIPEAGITMKTRFLDRSMVDFSKTKRACFDSDGLVYPLEVRNFRPGDRMQPLGLQGTQKIKKIFIDRKIDKGKRMIIPMVKDSLSIIWVPEIRISERVKVSDATKRILEIEIV